MIAYTIYIIKVGCHLLIYENWYENGGHFVSGLMSLCVQISDNVCFAVVVFLITVVGGLITLV